MKKLFVYFNQELAGYLYQENGKMSFEYSEQAISKNTAQLSCSLAIKKARFNSEITEAFFQGLLPEGSAKSIIAKDQKISTRNTFALLAELGRDCAGSIEIYPDEISFKQSKCADFAYKTEDESYEILTNLEMRPLYYGDDDFRVSGAGAQDKLIACLVDGLVVLPLNGTPSTHIFKPEINSLAQTCHNEYFCMNLALEIGLIAPKSQLIKLKDKTFYCVDRYDRFYENGVWKRIHQEDFCQALGVLPDGKYQSDGGPSLEDCFNLLDRIGVSGQDKIRFLRMIIFNFIVGNTDAHAKNFSIIYRGEKPELAPCYDIMSTIIYAHHYPKAKMAMKLMSQNYFSSMVNRENFAKLSEITGFKANFILKHLDDLCDKILKQAPLLAEKLNSEPLSISNCYDDILKIIEKHTKNVKM